MLTFFLGVLILAVSIGAVLISIRHASRRASLETLGESLARELHKHFIFFSDDFRDTMKVQSSVSLKLRRFVPVDVVNLNIVSTSVRRPELIKKTAEDWLTEKLKQAGLPYVVQISVKGGSNVVSAKR